MRRLKKGGVPARYVSVAMDSANSIRVCESDEDEEQTMHYEGVSDYEEEGWEREFEELGFDETLCSLEETLEHHLCIEEPLPRWKLTRTVLPRVNWPSRRTKAILVTENWDASEISPLELFQVFFAVDFIKLICN